jgi:hypothetical protein
MVFSSPPTPLLQEGEGRSPSLSGEGFRMRIKVKIKFGNNFKKSF